MQRAPKSSYGAYSPGVYSVIREILHVIGDINYQHEVKIHNTDTNSSDEAIKSYIKQKIQAAYQERRQPYIDLLNVLRSQQQR